LIEDFLTKLNGRVDEAEIIEIQSKKTSIKTKKTEIETFIENSSKGYGIRVIKDNKMGFYFTNTLDKSAIDNAIKISKSAQQDKHISLPEKQKYQKNLSSEVDMEVEKGLKMAKELTSSNREYKGVNPTSGIVSWGTSRIKLENTKGVYGEKSEFTLSVYLGTVIKENEAATGFNFEVSRKNDIDAHLVGAKACKLAKDSLKPKRIDTSKMRIILRPMAVTELFESTLIPSFNADNVQRGRSKLSGMVGEALFNDIDIIDDGTLKNGLMSERFDDEGVTTSRTTLVKNGTLKGFLYDSYSANIESVMSTGNGSRPSHAALPGVQPSNFIVSGPKKIGKEKGALVVNGLIGAHTANPISGDFSCETRNAFLDEVPIKKAIVSGNIFELLKKGVYIGSDVKQYSSTLSPSIEFQEVNVVG